MPITVNTNMSSIIAQKSLLNSTNSMSDALKRLSTGVKINSSKDDASGKTISDKIEYKNRSYSVAMNNAQMGLSMLDTANGNLSKMNDLLQKMRDLTEQASNGTYSDSDRKAMQSEINELSNEIYRIKNSTEFNGKKIFGEELFEKSVPTLSMADISADNWNSTINEIVGISSAQELKKLADILNSGKTSQNRTFALTNDIDLNDLEMTSNGNWTPIYNLYNATFDGNGFTIFNMNITDDTEDCNLGFIRTSSHSTVKNLNIENANVNNLANDSTRTRTGILIAITYFSTTQNCNASGNVYSKSRYVGGLIGQNTDNSTVENCSTSGSVTGTTRVGGLIGSCYEKSIVSNSYSISNVKSIDTIDSKVGGLVGINVNSNRDSSDTTTKSIIKNCWAGGHVSSLANSNETAGLVGWNRTSDIINCSYDAVGTGQANGLGRIENPNLTQVDPILDIKDNPVNKISVKTNLQVGIDSDKTSVIEVDTGFSLGNLNISLLSEFSAQNSLSKLDNLMNKINKKMTELGATQNRLENIIQYQQTQKTTLTATNSIIKDTDIAKESSRYIKNQILQNISASLLSTANQSPSIALQLINTSNNLNTNKLKTNVGFD